MTTCVTPSSRICANSRCSIGASGVVSSVATSRPMIFVPVVPISPTLQPAAVSPFSSMYVVVVLPEVPVTPRSVKLCDGCPYTSAATCPKMARTSSTTSTGRRSAVCWIIARPASSVSMAPAAESNA